MKSRSGQEKNKARAQGQHQNSASSGCGSTGLLYTQQLARSKRRHWLNPLGFPLLLSTPSVKAPWDSTFLFCFVLPPFTPFFRGSFSPTNHPWGGKGKSLKCFITCLKLAKEMKMMIGNNKVATSSIKLSKYFLELPPELK